MGPVIALPTLPIWFGTRCVYLSGGATILGELGTIRRYSHWSDRRIRSIAEDNEIDLDPPSAPLIPESCACTTAPAEVAKERKGCTAS